MALNRCFRLVAIHNVTAKVHSLDDPLRESIFDPRIEYGFPERVIERMHFCGYVVNRDEAEASVEGHMTRADSNTPTRPVVVTTTGGGEDGSFVLESFIRASIGAG